MFRRIAVARWSLVVAGCGGTVVFEDTSGGDGGSGPGGTSNVSGTSVATSAGATSSTSVSSSAVSSTHVAASTASGGSGCEGQPCGAFCEVCTPDCSAGFCDGDGRCALELDGGPGRCPPSDQVISGEPCEDEGVFCASDGSCSGVLQCRCGGWTLVHPC